MSERSMALINKVEFHVKGVRNNFLSNLPENTGKPKYDNKLYITFTRTDGSQWCRPAYDIDKRLYPEAFKAFEGRREASEDGSALSELKGIIPSELETLKELNIKTVECLAAQTQTQMQGLGERFEQLRQYAVSFLKQRKDMEEVFILRKQLEDANTRIAKLELDEQKDEEPQKISSFDESSISKKQPLAEEPDGQEATEDPFGDDEDSSKIKKRRGKK